MEALGPVLILVSNPLLFRWIPQNRVYGFRSPATFRKTSVWYDANALCARHLILLGLALVSLEFAVPAESRILTLGTVATIGLLVITISAWRTANRWDRERDRTQQ
jgi:hypothetical protein